jgi:hypothetical protein
MQAADDDVKRPKCLGSRCDQDGVGSARMAARARYLAGSLDRPTAPDGRADVGDVGP